MTAITLVASCQTETLLCGFWRRKRGTFVRFALSAAAAASGLLLLGLAIFGQPDAYLRMAREQWASLTDTAPPEQDQSQPTPAMAASLAQLQQQVLQLRDEVAARRDEAEQARQALAAAQAQRESAEREAERQSRQEAADRQAAEQPPAAPPAPARGSLVPSTEREDIPPPAQVVVVPERPAAPERREPPALPDRRAAAKPAAPPPRPAPRQEADNAQSVLARLRQAAPAVASAPDAPSAPERVNRGPSPSLRRLIAARAALASGQIEDTRRLLQEAQLQLVFRPVGSAEDDPVPAGRAASDVAHALDALSGNDISLSRSYIDRAVDDTSGHATDAVVREQLPVTPGYAPAYPLR